MNNWMSLILNGWWAVLVPPLQHSLGCRTKNKATEVSLLMEMFLGMVPWAAMSMAWMTLTGVIHTLVGEESSF